MLLYIPNLNRELGGVKLDVLGASTSFQGGGLHQYIKSITVYQHLKHTILAHGIEPSMNFPRTTGVAHTLLKNAKAIHNYFEEDHNRLTDIIGGRIEVTLGL